MASSLQTLAFVQARSVSDLLALHGEILDELRRRGILRSGNAPGGDFAEYLFREALGWTLEANSQEGYDAKDSKGKRYQIKSRRVTQPERNGSRQLSVIRNIDLDKFDFLAGVLFNSDYSVRNAIVIPHDLLVPLVRFSRHVNGYRFNRNDEIWTLKGVLDVTNELRNAAKACRL